jgi:hypothetical protein
MALGCDHQVAVVIGVFVEHNDGVFAAVEDKAFTIIPLMLPVAEDAAFLFCVRYIRHPPGGPQLLHPAAPRLIHVTQGDRKSQTLLLTGTKMLVKRQSPGSPRN